MRPLSIVLRPSRLIPLAATLLVTACSETTTPPTPAKLAFTVQPTSTTGGGTIPVVEVTVQDANGNPVTTATNTVTLTIGANAPGGALSGATSISAVNGVARFFSLSINTAGAGYTLIAASPNLASATSAPFSMSVGAPVKLAFTVQPSTTTAGTPIIPGVTVAVQDAGGNTVTTATNSITVAIVPGPGGVLDGRTVVAAANGVAGFFDLSIKQAGNYALMATSQNVARATSVPFTVATGPAFRLAFTVPPVTTPAGVTLTPAVAVAVQDLAGNTLTAATNVITVALGANPGSGILSGTTSAAPVGGVAIFSNLSIDKVGVDYTLTAAAAGLVGDVSNAFSIRNPLIFATVTAGYFHTCGLVMGGAPYCWGSNSEGQLGNAAWSAASAPVAVSGGLTFAGVSAGRTNTCSVTGVGVAYCWGSDNNGGSRTVAPAVVPGGFTFASITSGYAHTCGVTPQSAGFCWGDNSSGELGNAAGTTAIPAAVSGGLSFATISPGRYFTCGLTTSALAYCWGDNTFGQLGDGTKVQRSGPVAVAGQLKFSVVSAGGFHACGLTTGGLAYCWGRNEFGELGNGTLGTGSLSNTPVAVSGGLTFASLSVGNRHTCGVTPGGIAYCWGENSPGHLGNGTLENSPVPVAVLGGLKFASVSAGRFHSCGVTTVGAAYCWGDNSSGILGDGTGVASRVPVPVR